MDELFSVEARLSLKIDAGWVDTDLGERSASAEHCHLLVALIDPCEHGDAIERTLRMVSQIVAIHRPASEDHLAGRLQVKGHVIAARQVAPVPARVMRRRYAAIRWAIVHCDVTVSWCSAGIGFQQLIVAFEEEIVREDVVEGVEVIRVA